MHSSPRSLRSVLLAWINNEIATLYPGCFALVMATGIISNALFLEGYRNWSVGLLAVNVVAYPLLVFVTVLRLARYSRALWADLIDPRLVFSFFTIVAGTDVLGIAINLRGFTAIALLMWLFALAVWFVLIYFSFGVLVFSTPHMAPMSCMAVGSLPLSAPNPEVILGTVVAPETGNFSAVVFVLIHMLWGVGLGLYGIFVTLFAYRIFFFDVEPDDITPLLWVVMGAAAITANAGSTLILTDNGMAFLHSMRPFIDGVTLIMWAWATWWIPLLLLFGIWKHGICRVPITYTPMFWSWCFPSACTRWRACDCRSQQIFHRCGRYRALWCGSRLPLGSRPDLVLLPRRGPAFEIGFGLQPNNQSYSDDKSDPTRGACLYVASGGNGCHQLMPAAINGLTLFKSISRERKKGRFKCRNCSTVDW